jgi:hypothetical protein
MSLKHEQYRALFYTRELLHDLLHPSTRPKTVAETKARVKRCLRHFPPLDRTGAPMFSQDGIECPRNVESAGDGMDGNDVRALSGAGSIIH